MDDTAQVSAAPASSPAITPSTSFSESVAGSPLITGGKGSYIARSSPVPVKKPTSGSVVVAASNHVVSQNNNIATSSPTTSSPLSTSLPARLAEEPMKEYTSQGGGGNIKPRLLGVYQFGDELGKGAFGRVYRGINIQTGEVVAIKQMEKSRIAQDSLESIVTELELLQRLYNPNIVNYVEFQETKDHIYFVLEYVEGGSLYNVMKRFGNFSEPLLARYLTQVLRGLEYLHRQGVIHRDIKGANISVNNTGQCKLADFGSCTYEAIHGKDVVGTPFWMAPEIIEGKGCSFKSDIWSVGCMVIELITGSPPHWASGADLALFRMVQQPHPPLPKVSNDLEDFLLNCFVRDVEKRPSANDLLAHRWIISVFGSSQALPEPTISNPAKKPKPKKKGTEIRKEKKSPYFFKQQKLQNELNSVLSEKQTLVQKMLDLTEKLSSLSESKQKTAHFIETTQEYLDRLKQERLMMRQAVSSVNNQSPKADIQDLVDTLNILLRRLTTKKSRKPNEALLKLIAGDYSTSPPSPNGEAGSGGVLSGLNGNATAAAADASKKLEDEEIDEEAGSENEDGSSIEGGSKTKNNSHKESATAGDGDGMAESDGVSSEPGKDESNKSNESDLSGMSAGSFYNGGGGVVHVSQSINFNSQQAGGEDDDTKSLFRSSSLLVNDLISWMVPGVRCQVKTSNDEWVNGVIMSHNSDGSFAF
eukprot:TRINITY_DN6093_c0_g1_i1.p1 TRINITY_DN6093_c0_g1~~TRINITY_DN6093_c0_g1_i1.p1  ORF type:complete len:702 (+),score=199.13 TRINITY_DN6093_c0_g1_i1:52-2157(+)